MEESINQRLKKFIEDKGINEPDTYKYLGTRRQIWNGWLNAEEAIPLNKVQKLIARFPDINARWFLTGEGEMLIKKAQGSILSIPEEKMNVVEEPYTCPNCVILRNKINKLYEDLIEAKNETIAAQNGEQKNKKAN